MPSVKKTENFTLSFLIWILFTTLPCHVVLLGLGILCQISVRASALAIFLIAEEKKTFRLVTVEHHVSFGFVMYGFYYVEVHSFSSLLRIFFMKENWILLNAFSAFIVIVRPLSFIPLLCPNYWCAYVKPSLHSSDDKLNVLLTSVW